MRNGGRDGSLTHATHVGCYRTDTPVLELYVQYRTVASLAGTEDIDAANVVIEDDDDDDNATEEEEDDEDHDDDKDAIISITIIIILILIIIL
jgi:hypothetical protein